MRTTTYWNERSFIEKTHCRYCEGALVKFGKTTDQKQRYRCKNCRKTQLKAYRYLACAKNMNPQIIALLKEGVGIRGMARLLAISTTTLLRRIRLIADQIQEPLLVSGQQYEVDELCTYIKKKGRRVWVVSAYCREQQQLVRFYVGRRNRNTLAWVLKSLLLSHARRVYTDRYRLYRSLIPSDIHSTRPFATNHIERVHLNLRTHLKRLHRRSIGFSRSQALLSASLKIYHWG
jgi:insertion element IS1 protein InsB